MFLHVVQQMEAHMRGLTEQCSILQRVLDELRAEMAERRKGVPGGSSSTTCSTAGHPGKAVWCPQSAHQKSHSVENKKRKAEVFSALLSWPLRHQIQVHHRAEGLCWSRCPSGASSKTGVLEMVTTATTREAMRQNIMGMLRSTTQIGVCRGNRKKKGKYKS